MKKLWRLLAITGLGAVAWNIDTVWMLIILWATMILLGWAD